MPYVLKRRSLASHIGDVVMAPIIFLMVGRMMAAWIIPVIGLCLLFIWICGGNIGPAKWDWEFVVAIVGTVLFIALAAIPLALREWLIGAYIPEWSADAGQECVETAKRFAVAVLDRDPAAAARLTSGAFSREAFEAVNRHDSDYRPQMGAAPRSELAVRELNRRELSCPGIEGRIQSKPRDGRLRAIVVVSIAGIDEWIVELVVEQGGPRVEGFGPA